MSLLDAEQIDQNVSEPAHTWQNILAFFSLGPSSFNEYYYWYALLDCATQVGRIVEKGKIPQGLVNKVREIIRKSKSSSIRWKAVSSTSTNVSQLQALIKPKRSNFYLKLNYGSTEKSLSYRWLIRGRF